MPEYHGVSRRSSFILALLLLGGCIVIPNLGAPPFKEQLEDVERGTTTKAEILEKFGPPAARFFDESEFLYRSTDWRYFVLAGGGYQVGGADIQYEYYLWLRFDNGDMLSDHLMVRVKPGRAPIEFRSLIAAVLEVESDSVEFINRAFFRTARGCNSASAGRELINSKASRSYFVSGAGFIALIDWTGEGYELKWKHGIDEVVSVSDSSWFGGRCFVIDFDGGFSATLAMATAGGGIVRSGLTRDVGSSVRAAASTSSPAPD